MNRRRLEKGAVAFNGTIFAIVALSILVVLFGSFSIWAYINYMDQKNNVDGKVEEAVAEAVRKNSEVLEAKFEAQEKEPMRQFMGPSDYGSLSFKYPKTWSAYQATDVSKGGGVTYEAYLNPILVPPITPTTKYAIRISIEQKTYDQTLASYDKLIKKGEITSSVYSVGDLVGTQLTGNFTKDIYGTAVILKMRDRTLTVRTDGDVMKEDFFNLLKTLKFNE